MISKRDRIIAALDVMTEPGVRSVGDIADAIIADAIIADAIIADAIIAAIADADLAEGLADLGMAPAEATEYVRQHSATKASAQ